MMLLKKQTIELWVKYIFDPCKYTDFFVLGSVWISLFYNLYKTTYANK